MKPNISEFSYGYALTDELVNWYKFPITAAPVFPSLYDEGKPGGGYDVKLDMSSILLFIQFKLSHCMIRNTAKTKAFSSTPFYRMRIRPRHQSNQHEMLLELEKAGNEVYYTAPAFHESKEFDDAYFGHMVARRSLWLEPSWIGPIVDNNNHHVAFKLGGPVHVYSEPRHLETKANYDEFSEHITASFNER